MTINWRKWMNFLRLIGVANTVLLSQCVCARDVDKIDVGQFDFTLATGYWQQDNPLIFADDQVSYTIPHWSYYGKQIFIENFTLGFSFHENDNQRWSWLVTPDEEYVFFHFADQQQPIRLRPRDGEPSVSRVSSLHENNFSYSTGIEYVYYGDHWQWSWNLLSSTAQGVDAYVSNWQSLQDWQCGAWHVQTSVLARYASADYVDYYFAASDANKTPPSVYHGNASWSFAYGIDAEYPLTTQWSWLMQFRQRLLGDGISDSPLIKQKNIEQYFVGFLFAYP